MSKVRLGFDIETNNLLPDVNTIWILTIVNRDTGIVTEYSDWDNELPSLSKGLDHLKGADILFGHNIIGYDLIVLRKLAGWSPSPKTSIIDTWILSQLVQYKRKHKHGLEGWGEYLHKPKVENEVWDHYAPIIRERCKQDVLINLEVYNILATDARKIIAKHPLFAKGMDVEMRFAMIEANIRDRGWVFDMVAAEKLLGEIHDKLETTERVLEPKIGLRTIKPDGTDIKKPAWRKDGCYTLATSKYFGIEETRGRTDRPIEGEYCRVAFEQGKIGQIEVIKDYLYSIGWKPDEWNMEKINGKFVKKSPKITESSLKALGPEAQSISEYYTVRARKGILEGWIDEVKKSDGRLHGRMWTMGTPTFRCRHEVIANLPGVQHDKEGNILYGVEGGYGYEIRSLLQCEPGTTIVGADSAGNQMRGLCHYIGDQSFTDEVINGDVHQRNADTLSKVYPCPRKTAKPWLYAYLFGAGAPKLGSILTGKSDSKVGKESADLFESSIPGLKALKDRLNKGYERTAAAFGADMAHIRGVDGRLIFVSSPHQVLNYLLQTAEGVTCKAAAVYLEDELRKRKIHHYFALHYHDEWAIICKEEDAELVAELSIKAFTEAPKQFGIECMSGAASIGSNYAQVH